MNNKLIYVICFLPFLTGCVVPKGDVQFYQLRGIGLRIALNPQTQTPEVMLGYFAMQYHLIPTGKTPGTGDASQIPPIVSDFTFNGQFSMQTISDTFATGTAHDSGAARLLFEPKMQLGTTPRKLVGITE